MLAVPPVEPITAATPLAFPSDAGHPQGISSSAATRLDEFWFSEVDLAPLGLFRIIFGIELLNWFWQLLPNLGAFFTEDRMLPGATLRPLRSDASMMSGLEKLGGSPAPPRYPFSTSPMHQVARSIGAVAMRSPPRPAACQRSSVWAHIPSEEGFHIRAQTQTEQADLNLLRRQLGQIGGAWSAFPLQLTWAARDLLKILDREESLRQRSFKAEGQSEGTKRWVGVPADYDLLLRVSADANCDHFPLTSTPFGGMGCCE